MATEAPLQPTAAHSQTDAPYQPSLDNASNVAYEIPRGPVEAELKFYAPPVDGSNPWNYVEDPPEGLPKFNFGYADHNITIDDIRGREHHFNLDDNAFETIGGVPSEEKDFTDDEHIKQVYYPEVEKLLLENLPGANRVLLFDHTIRRSNPGASRAPVVRVHIDQTPWSAAERVKVHLPDEAEKLLQGRYRIVNVWRPLNGPVASFPLAVADSSNVRDEDLVSVEHRYPHRTGETALVRQNDEQRWFYWSGMTNEERLLLKCFDSDERFGGNGRVPHTAFVDPRTPANAPGRESIEVRALVFG